MSGNVRVPHERGFTVKFSQAIKSIRNGCLAWTDETHTLLRDCTLAEQFERQVIQAQMREPLPVAEIPGIKFEPSVSGREAYRMGRQMVLDATAMCAGYYHPVSA